MTNKEKIYLQELSKISYIIKVINSCLTMKQLENTKEWGVKVVENLITPSIYNASSSVAYERYKYKLEKEDQILEAYFNQKIKLTNDIKQ
jgi:hypothetical protein